MDMDNLNLAIMKKWKISFCMVIACLVLELSNQGHAVEGTYMDKETRIVIIGKTGAGKSATGNSILGKEVFKSQFGLTSETRATSYSTAWRFNRNLVVVDTPGLEDTEVSTTEVLKEITKSYTLVSPGPHAFVMLVDPNRFTKEDKRILDVYKEYFGQNLFKYLVLVFTNKKRIEEVTTLEKFVKEIPETHSIKKLIKSIKNRYLAMDYSRNLKNQEEDVLKLLKMIEKMQKENNPEFFETEISKYTEELYDYLGKTLDNKGDTDNKGNKREQIRERISNMFVIYALEMAAVIAYAYFSGDGITAGKSILEKLMEHVSFFVQHNPI